MNLELVGKDLQVTEMLKARVEQKLSKIESRLGEPIFVRVSLSQEPKESYSCTVRFSGARHDFSATATGSDLVKASDEAIDRVERQVQKVLEARRQSESIRAEE